MRNNHPRRRRDCRERRLPWFLYTIISWPANRFKPLDDRWCNECRTVTVFDDIAPVNFADCISWCCPQGTTVAICSECPAAQQAVEHRLLHSACVRLSVAASTSVFPKVGSTPNICEVRSRSQLGDKGITAARIFVGIRVMLDSVLRCAVAVAFRWYPPRKFSLSSAFLHPPIPFWLTMNAREHASINMQSILFCSLSALA